MEVENRWGNTKYLLGQMIPGKHQAYRAMTRTKSYLELVEALEYDATFAAMARRVDEALEIGDYGKPKVSKAERKAANKAAVKQERPERGELKQAAVGIKRTAEMAELDMPPDVARESGPGS
ncbi:tRNA-dihydrouridine synthase 2, partial [Teratosphaeriaceae sp. CCFEE 6253]